MIFPNDSQFFYIRLPVWCVCSCIWCVWCVCVSLHAYILLLICHGFRSAADYCRRTECIDGDDMNPYPFGWQRQTQRSSPHAKGKLYLILCVIKWLKFISLWTRVCVCLAAVTRGATHTFIQHCTQYRQKWNGISWAAVRGERTNGGGAGLRGG